MTRSYQHINCLQRLSCNNWLGFISS